MLLIANVLPSELVKRKFKLAETPDVDVLQKALSIRPLNSNARLVLIGYPRPCVGFPPALLNTCGRQYRMQPEIMRMHHALMTGYVGSHLQVSHRPLCKPSTLLLEISADTVLSAQMCTEEEQEEAKTCKLFSSLSLMLLND